MVGPDDLQRASERVRFCLARLESLIRGLVAHWPAESVPAFQDLAADRFGKLALALVEADGLLTAEMSRLLDRAADTRGLAPLEYGQERFANAHEAVLWHVEAALRVPVVRAPILETSFHVFLREVAADRWSRLGEALAGFLPADPFAYWGGVACELERFPLDQVVGLAGRLQAECAQAANLVEEAPRVVVDVERRTVTIEGVAHNVESDRAVRWIKVLADRPGVWVSSRELRAHDDELDDVRTDHLRKFLPKEIDHLVESQTGAGSRLVLGPPGAHK